MTTRDICDECGQLRELPLGPTEVVDGELIRLIGICEECRQGMADAVIVTHAGLRGEFDGIPWEDVAAHADQVVKDVRALEVMWTPDGETR